MHPIYLQGYEGALRQISEVATLALTLLQRLLKERLERLIELRGFRADADVALWTAGVQDNLNQQRMAIDCLCGRVYVQCWRLRAICDEFDSMGFQLGPHPSLRRGGERDRGGRLLADGAPDVQKLLLLDSGSLVQRHGQCNVGLERGGALLRDAELTWKEECNGLPNTLQHEY